MASFMRNAANEDSFYLSLNQIREWIVNNIDYICLPNSSITFKNSDICYIGPKYKNCFMKGII